MYVAPIGRLIHKLGINYYQYTDDTQLYTKLEVPVTTFWPLFSSALQHYMPGSVTLITILNPDKSKVIYIGTRQRLRISELPETVTVADSTIATTDKLKVHGRGSGQF